MKNEHLIVNGLDVQYTDHGKGPVVLLLHGWGTNLATFSPLITEWGAHDKRIIALDLPGFGGSEPPATAWDVSHYAMFVRDFLNKLSIDRPRVLIGHSFGGRIALKGISDKKLAPEYLVLIASAGMAQSHSSRNAAFSMLAKTGKVIFSLPLLSFFKEPFRQKLYAAAGSADYLTAGPMRETFLKIVRENLVEDARNIHTPTLLVWGEGDTETPLDEADALHRAIRDSQLAVIPHAGHFVHQEQPKEVAEKIAVFTNL